MEIELVKQLSLIIEKLIIPILLAIIGYLIWLSKEQIRKRNELEKQLSVKKYEVYRELIISLNKSISDKKGVQGFNFKEIFQKRPDMIIYASDKVLQKYNKFHNTVFSAKGIEEKEVYTFIAELMLLIRRDMGNSDTRLKLDEIIIPMFAENTEICEVSPHYSEILNKILGK